MQKEKKNLCMSMFIWHYFPKKKKKLGTTVQSWGKCWENWWIFSTQHYTTIHSEDYEGCVINAEREPASTTRFQLCFKTTMAGVGTGVKGSRWFLLLLSTSELSRFSLKGMYYLKMCFSGLFQRKEINPFLWVKALRPQGPPSEVKPCGAQGHRGA